MQQIEGVVQVTLKFYDDFLFGSYHNQWYALRLYASYPSSIPDAFFPILELRL